MRRNIVSIGTVLIIVFLFDITQAMVWYVHPDSSQNCIQDCLNACSTGDTVLVGPGTYYENILWPNAQGLKLISEKGPDTTIIDGDNLSYVIVIDVPIDNSSTISGFTIQNCGGGILCMIGSVTISGNIIKNNILCGVNLVNSKGVIIENNTIKHNTGFGIHLYWRTSGTVIKNNTIINNTRDGILVWSTNVFITNNFIANNRCGIGYSTLPLVDNKPINNSIISDNIITNNTRDGIVFLIFFVSMKNNIITNNGRHGILFDYPPYDTKKLCQETSTVDSCIIAGNLGDGVYITWCYPPWSLHINYCNICDNTGYGVNHAASEIVVDAKYNWWGDSTGPYHPILNPGGLGDSVSDYVDFEPWLLEPALGLFEQSRPVVKHTLLQTTIVRGVLNLHSAIYNPHSKIVLLDITGRKVANLKSGSNNIRHLAHGVYFIRSKNNNRVTKIIITK